MANCTQIIRNLFSTPHFICLVQTEADESQIFLTPPLGSASGPPTIVLRSGDPSKKSFSPFL